MLVEIGMRVPLGARDAWLRPARAAEALCCMAKRKARNQRRSGRDPNPGWVVTQLDPIAREQLRAGVQKAAKTAGPDFGQALKELDKAVATVSPVDLICSMSLYFLTTLKPGENPEFNRPEEVFQHHVELIYAVALRRSLEEVEPSLLVSKGTEPILDAAKRSVAAFMLLEAKARGRATDEVTAHRRSILHHLRIHGAVVRGMSYFEDQRRLIAELFGPIDDQIASEFGFRCAGLAKWWWSISEEVEARLELHFQQMQKFNELPLDEEWPARAREIFQRLPIRPDADLTARLSASPDERLAFTVFAADLNLFEVFGFTIDQLLDLYPGEITEQSLALVLDEWSLGLGALSEVPLNTLIASNPVLRKPILRLDDHLFICSLSSTFLHSGLPMLEGLFTSDRDLAKPYFDRRAEFLEAAVLEAFQRKFPISRAFPGVHWIDPRDEREYETDLLLLVGSHALIVECKGGRMSRQAMEGKSRDLKDAISELIVAPAEQAQRLATLLEGRSEPLEMTGADGTPITIDAADVHEAVTLGTTLEPLAAVLPNMRDLTDAGLTGPQLDAITYSLSLYDLWTVLDMLEHPSEVLHYFKRRGELENGRFLNGEENDLLGFYLKSGFNLGEAEFEDDPQTQVYGLSDEIDVYYYSREAGLAAVKPAVSRSPYWEELLAYVEERKNPRWTEVGVALCNVAVEEQESFCESMRTLQRRAGTSKASDFFLMINGPERRRDYFVGLLVESEDRAERESKIDRSASDCFEQHPDAERVICIGWPPDGPGAPYRVFAVVDRRPEDVAEDP
jgi:hypothetical protein